MADAASFAAAGTAVAEQKRPARDKADGDDSPRKLLTVPSDVVVGADDDDLFIDQLDQPSDVQRRELDQMHEMFLGLPLAADEEHVTCLTIVYRWLGES